MTDIYRELYANSTPYGDFDKIVENAEIIDGIKQIPFLEYDIDEALMDRIIKKHFLINNLRKREKDAINFEICLGCSPKTKSSF